MSRRCVIRSSNRIAILGSAIASFGFFFLPLLEIKPNRLASGLSVGLLEIQGDLRYLLLFILALSPMFLAFISESNRRGWSLVAVGNLLILLTMMLPAIAGNQLIVGAETLFEEGTQISNPRILTSGAMAFGLLGGYIVLFGGLLDLESVGTPRFIRLIAGIIGIFSVVIILLDGSLDIYSIMVEYNIRGETLSQRFIEHLVFVIVALIAGLIVGIALGLWASRDERAEDVILYTVGIIQTIPSLALFGVLLVPLARLGDQSFLGVFRNWIIMVVGAAILVFVVRLIMPQLPARVRQIVMVVTFAVVAIPLALLVTLLISFGFEAILNVFTLDDISLIRTLTGGAIVAIPLIIALDRQLDPTRKIPSLVYVRYVATIIAGIGIVYLMWIGSREVIGSTAFGDLTVRDLGVSGIGTAPAIIALTLYSLLPLVRNTYAGLTNIDPAIIDSGRGMGMTPAQIFFQIELPLAFPVIMAGIRNAGVSLVGIAAVASIIGAGALGDFILLGVNSTSIDQILLGAIPAVVLAVFLDAALQILERLLTSPGIRQT